MAGRDNSFAVQPCDISTKIEGSSQRKMRASEKLTVFKAEPPITGVEDLDAFLRPHRKQAATSTTPRNQSQSPE